MPELAPIDEPDIVVTFRVARGSFEVPGELFDDGREHELGVYLASRLPLACTSITRRYERGIVTITWRKVRIAPISGQGNGPAITSDNGARRRVTFQA